MTLAEFNLLMVSIAATLFSTVLIMLIISSLTIYKRVNKILSQLEAMSAAGLETSHIVRDFVNTTSHKVSSFTQSFLTFKGATEVVSSISEVIKKAKSNSHKDKETPHV
jgi:hypothetical protein